MIKTPDPLVRLDVIDSEKGQELNHKRNDPYVRDWCRQEGLVDDYQQAEWIADISVKKSVRMYAIRSEKDLKRENDYVGICGFTDIDHLHRRAEFSCYIFPEYRLRGYCKTALQGLFRHGFDDLNFNIIWGETFEGNPAMKIFQSIGMQIEGKRRQFYFKKGKYIDAYLLSVLRSEFEKHWSHIK